MSEGDEIVPDDPRRRPADPAGTRPRHDPDALLPAEREPLLHDDVIDAEPVAEGGDGDDMLPVRRRPGAMAEPVAPAQHSTYAPRFHFLTGALLAVGIAALVGLAAVIVIPGSGGDGTGPRWSNWVPTASGTDGATQIARHVAGTYKLSDGRQMVDVSATGLEIQGVPLAVAVREAPEKGGDIRVFDDSGIIYRLCGLGPDCAISSGKASEKRHLLLRREALELALYSFRYLGDVHQVIVFMPPALGQKPSQALFFREGDVARELDRPLTASLSPRVPSVSTVTLSPDAPLVDQITTSKLFHFSLTQANTDNRGFIVLDPSTAAADPTSGSGSPSSGSGSGSSSGSDGHLSTSSGG